MNFRLNLSDRDLIRFLRIGNTLFSLIRTYEEENSVKTTVEINNKVENVFDQFLDHFTQGDSSVSSSIILVKLLIYLHVVMCACNIWYFKWDEFFILF